ncbi:hypothetical protein AAHA92_33987 [Salvia divinorum]|uniref:Secreted protein n=1 Tax=Salvia divinorum TaxID=28513 RepID=A0ABD1FK30_SALDI
MKHKENASFNLSLSRFFTLPSLLVRLHPQPAMASPDRRLPAAFPASPTSIIGRRLLASGHRRVCRRESFFIVSGVGQRQQHFGPCRVCVSGCA